MEILKTQGKPLHVGTSKPDYLIEHLFARLSTGEVVGVKGGGPIVGDNCLSQSKSSAS